MEDPAFHQVTQTGSTPPLSVGDKDLAEIDQSQVEQFAAAAYWSGFAGRLQILFGLYGRLRYRCRYRSEIIMRGVVTILIAFWTVAAASVLRRMSRRSDSDAQQAVIAATYLKSAFRLQIVVFLLIGFVTNASVATAGNLWSA